MQGRWAGGRRCAVRRTAHLEAGHVDVGEALHIDPNHVKVFVGNDDVHVLEPSGGEQRPGVSERFDCVSVVGTMLRNSVIHFLHCLKVWLVVIIRLKENRQQLESVLDILERFRKSSQVHMKSQFLQRPEPVKVNVRVLALECLDLTHTLNILDEMNSVL